MTTISIQTSDKKEETLDRIQEAINAVNEYGSQRAAAKALGIPRSTFNDLMRKAAKTGKDGLAIKSIPPGNSIKGVSTLYDADGNVKQQWIKSKPNEISIEDLAEYFKEAFRDYEGASSIVKSPLNTNSSILTIYPIADLHIGMLAWGAESGVDWDMKIAEDVILQTYAQIIASSQPSEECWLLNLGDYFHLNDSKNATPGNGHLLDVDSRYQKIIYTGARIMLKLIDMAREKHKIVRVRNTKGNHDLDATVALNVGLHMLYSNERSVIIEDSPKQLWARRFGNNLIGGFHGHTAKSQRAAMSLADEYRNDWGNTRYSTLYHGHFHQEKAEQHGTVRVIGLPTLAARDEYAASSMYGSYRAAMSITWHETRGEIGTNRVNL